MKKVLTLVFVLLLMLVFSFSLVACKGDTDNGANNNTQSAVSTDKSPKELAISCKDKSVSELFKLIGEPKSSEYVPSCLNPGVGEDGFLEYDGFTVYTYRAEGEETVYEVE